MANSKLTDEAYLIKLKRLNWSDHQIAQKLGLPVHAVAERWDALIKRQAAFEESGYNGLCDLFTIMCNQYELLGESLKHIATVLSDPVTASELHLIVTSETQETIDRLQKFIILRKFVPPPPEVPPEKN